MTISANQRGFSILIALLVIVVLAGLGGAGYYVWDKNKDADTDKKDNISQARDSKRDVEHEDTKKIRTNTLSLNNDSVKLTLPNGWTFDKGGNLCQGSVTSDAQCLEGAMITPNEKLPTRYGNGTEFFNIKISVFDNPKNSSPKVWLEKDFDQGSGDEDDVTMTNPVGGYDSYYWKSIYSGDGTHIREVSYVFTKADLAVLLSARIYEPGKLNDGTPVGDFRKFEASIAEMAESIQIQ